MDDSNFALDDFHDRDGDKFSDTGYMNVQDIIPENAGVRGPQSESILYLMIVRSWCKFGGASKYFRILIQI